MKSLKEKLKAIDDKLDCAPQYANVQEARVLLRTLTDELVDARGWGHPALVKQLHEERDKLRAALRATTACLDHGDYPENGDLVQVEKNRALLGEADSGERKHSLWTMVADPNYDPLGCACAAPGVADPPPCPHGRVFKPLT